MNARYTYLFVLALALPLSSCRFVGMRPDFSVLEDTFSPVEHDSVYVEGQPSGMMHLAAYQPPAPPAAAPAPTRATAPARPRTTAPATASYKPKWLTSLTTSVTSWFSQIWKPSAGSMTTNGTYTVRSGDSLSRIARIHKVSVRNLAAANGIDLQKPIIRPGQKLRIPQVAPRKAAPRQPAVPKPEPPAVVVPPATIAATPAGAPAPAVAPAPVAPLPANLAPAAPQPAAPQAAAPVAPAPAGQYRISEGDTPYGIARKHGISLQDLLQANNLNEESARNLRIGTLLTIPSQQHR